MTELQHIRTALNKIWLVTLIQPGEVQRDFQEAERMCRVCVQPQRDALLFVLSQVAVEIQRWTEIKRYERHCYVCGHDFIAKTDPNRCPFCLVPIGCFRFNNERFRARPRERRGVATHGAFG